MSLVAAAPPPCVYCMQQRGPNLFLEPCNSIPEEDRGFVRISVTPAGAAEPLAAVAINGGGPQLIPAGSLSCRPDPAGLNRNYLQCRNFVTPIANPPVTDMAGAMQHCYIGPEGTIQCLAKPRVVVAPPVIPRPTGPVLISPVQPPSPSPPVVVVRPPAPPSPPVVVVRPPSPPPQPECPRYMLVPQRYDPNAANGIF